MIYVRISEDRTGREAGVTRQREDCERRARERGWQVVAVESDNDQSAYRGRRRPGFEALLSRVKSGGADVVVAWSLDRLQRNRRDELQLYELCRDRNAAISLINGPDLDFTTATGRWIADQLGGIARFEVELKSDRQQRANAQAAADGRRVGGRRPFGYEPDGVTVREDEARAVREGYAALLAGVPLAQIARTWNADGFTPGQPRRDGTPSSWRGDNVRAVLRNPRYAGKRAHKGGIVSEAVWAPLVEESTWQAARALLDAPGRRSGPTSARALLTGLARCGVCGATVHAGGAHRGVRGYRCSGAFGHISRRAEPVDDYVSRVMVARLSQPDARDLTHDQQHPDLDALRREAIALRARMDSLAVDFADGALTASQLRAATERLQVKLRDAEAQMADAGRADVLSPLLDGGDVRAAWDALDTARQRAVIDTIAEVAIYSPGRGTRTFRPETVAITWKTK